MTEPTAQHLFDLGVEHHQAGRLHEAEQLYRRVLARQPEHAEALHNLGVIAQQAGQNEIAVTLLRRSLVLDPASAEGYINLGNALKETGRLEEAIAAYRQAADLKPNSIESYNNLGVALNDHGQPDEAIAAYRRAIALDPELPEPHNNLGNALKEKGQLDQAITAYRQAIALKPTYAEAHSNLSAAAKDKGQFDEAITASRKAIELNPNYAEAHFNLGNALKEKGLMDEAIAAYGQAITLRPGYTEAYINLGNVLKSKGQLDAAIAAYERAIALSPENAKAHSNFGSVLKDKGQLDDAVAVYRRAIALDPDAAPAHSNLVYAMQFHPTLDAAAIAEEQRRWNRQHAEPLARCIRQHLDDRTPGRRLRIGYVSPDFRDHCQSFFTVPLLSSHDDREMEIFCYADGFKHDALTERLRGYASNWRNIAGQSDEEVAELIREDRIDILVDLTMHMADNRLLVFARKPAPVQVCWLAYPGSTGLSTIDYRLSDPYLDPPGMDESIYSERTIRLPDSFWCYDPLNGRDIRVNSLPALETGIVTFGCLNNFCKINEGIIALWAQVLRQVKGSRLLLLAQPGSHRQLTLDRFERQGIEANRIEFVPPRSRLEYLKLYHRIDLGLDSFPYNGHTTSLDSFWMGVPVVTLVGQTAVARAGWCQLSNLGMPELAGQTGEQFVRLAVELANDLPRLKELRSTLRQRMEQSPLMDAPKFARNIESAYRRMWQHWCETGS